MPHRKYTFSTASFGNGTWILEYSACAVCHSTETCQIFPILAELKVPRKRSCFETFGGDRCAHVVTVPQAWALVETYRIGHWEHVQVILRQLHLREDVFERGWTVST